MKPYQALTTSRGAIDIGTYADINAARVWALQEYGADLQDVQEISTITVETSALDSGWVLAAALAVLVGMVLTEREKRKRKRGRHVSTRR
jgi:predicted outer membrane lipoprotein